jgi:hypothetical protein
MIIKIIVLAVMIFLIIFGCLFLAFDPLLGDNAFREAMKEEWYRNQ